MRIIFLTETTSKPSESKLFKFIDRYLDIIFIIIGIPMSIGFFVIPLFWSPLAIGFLLTFLGSMDLLFDPRSRDKLRGIRQ